MDKPFDYIAEANVTASNNYHGDKVPLAYLREVLNEAINALTMLDGIKKTLFYGRELPRNALLVASEHESPATCQTLPYRITVDVQKAELILHSIIGAATENGELLELLRAVMFEGKPFDPVNFAEEIGDTQWYNAIGLGAVGTNFDDVHRTNIAKLRHRFPEKFTEYEANNRDLFGERAILENGFNPNNKPVAVINNWGQFGDVLIGDVVGHPKLGNEECCRTSRIVNMNEAGGFCETVNTFYKLGPKATPFAERAADEEPTASQTGLTNPV